MNTSNKKILSLLLILACISNNALGAAFIKRHAAKATGAFTGLCGAAFLRTSVKSWRQGTGLPIHSKEYLAHGFTVICGTYLTYLLRPERPKPAQPPVANPVPRIAPTVHHEPFPWHKGVMLGQIKVINELLRRPDMQDRINELNEKGGTALYIATVLCDNNIIAALLSNPKIKVNTQNSNGVAPLLQACRSASKTNCTSPGFNRYLQAIELLLQHGADPLIKNNKGESAAAILKNLKEKGAQQTNNDKALIALFEKYNKTKAEPTEGKE